MGWTKGINGPGISEVDFLDNSFLSVWDISTAKAPPSDLSKQSIELWKNPFVINLILYFFAAIPTIRRGVVQLNINFSSPISEELTIFIHSEYSAVLSVDNKRLIGTSYLTSLN